MSSTLNPTSSAHLLRVGDLVKATGKTARALHLYEELGLLKPATRSSGGFRLFDPSAVERVRWIDSLHSLGFSLNEMHEVLQNWWTAEHGPAAMAELQVLFVRKLEETRETLRRHELLARELEEGLRYLETCESCDAPDSVRHCVNCRQDHGGIEAPSLVAGIRNAPEGARRTSRPAFVRVEDMATLNTLRADSNARDAVRKERDE